VNAARSSSGLELLVIPERAESALWRRWSIAGETPARMQLFDRYSNLARIIAVAECRRRPLCRTDRSDVDQLAYEGLLQAIDRYDPLRNTPFSAFARRRISGSVRDGLSRQNEASAQNHAVRQIVRDRARSVASAGRGAQDDPIALLSDITFELALGVMIEESALIERDDGSDGRPNAYDSLAWRQQLSVLIDAVGELQGWEGHIIRYHYEQSMSFVQIAHLLGLSKGRISQLHSRALGKLRTMIDDQRG